MCLSQPPPPSQLAIAGPFFAFSQHVLGQTLQINQSGKCNFVLPCNLVDVLDNNAGVVAEWSNWCAGATETASDALMWTHAKTLRSIQIAFPVPQHKVVIVIGPFGG